MDTLISSIQQFAATANETVRRQLMLSLRAVANSLEEPSDTIHRFGHGHLQAASIRVGIDLGLFKYLASSDQPHVTLEQIVEKTGGDAAFLGRYLRYLGSVNIVKETGKDQFAANHTTKNLAEKVAECGMLHCFDTISPQYQAMPRFLRKNGHKNPTDPLDTVLQEAFDTKLDAFSWLAANPDNLRYFNDYMASRRKPEVSWLSVYPVTEELTSSGWADAPADRAVYVNIGGGVGHQCAEFKQKFPDVKGRVVLQDLAHSIEKALPTEGVENMAHDYLQEQPIKGAKFYYMRGVLHNQPDDKAATLLSRTRDAMVKDSVLLVDDLVLPDQGTDSYSATVDLTMMCSGASLERSESQWAALLEQVGLKLVKTYPYNIATSESVMAVVLP